GDQRCGVAVATHEFRGVTEGQVQNVVKDQHLAIAVRARTDTDCRGLHFGRDHGCDLAWNSFEVNAGDAGSVERGSIAHELLDVAERLALHLVSAHDIHRLRGKADVACHRNFRVDDAPDQISPLLAAFDLDRFCSSLLDEACSIAHRFFGTEVVRAVRHIADDKGVFYAAPHGPRVV